MSLLRNFATVGGATLLSRVLGFARDVLIAGALGAGPIADAFVAAFRLPNLFRRIFAEGAFNAAFVPLFARTLEGDGTRPEAETREAARAFAAEAMAGLGAVLIAITVAALVFMPLLTYAFAPGFAGDPAKFDLTVLLSRICFPYLLCVSLTALMSGVLNGFRRFAAAAFAPVALNVVLIAALGVVYATGRQGEPWAAVALSIGVAIAGAVQLGLLTIALRRLDFRIPLRRPRWTPGMKRLLRLGLPGVVAGGGLQIGIWIGTLIASLQEGAISWLYYADRLYQLPLGLIGIAIGVVLLPDISRRLRAGDASGAAYARNRAMEFALLLTLPSAAALGLCAEPIVRALFERGAFEAEATAATAAALTAYAFGLPAFVIAKVYQPVYFAAEDTATPARFTLIQIGVNTVGAAALFPVFGHVGIALATAAAAWVNVALLHDGLRRTGRAEIDPRLERRLPRIVLSAALMGGALVFAAAALDPWLSVAGRWSGLVALTGLVTAGLIVYAGAALVSGAIKPADLQDLRRRPTIDPSQADPL